MGHGESFRGVPASDVGFCAVRDGIEDEADGGGRGPEVVRGLVVTDSRGEEWCW